MCGAGLPRFKCALPFETVQWQTGLLYKSEGPGEGRSLFLVFPVPENCICSSHYFSYSQVSISWVWYHVGKKMVLGMQFHFKIFLIFVVMNHHYNVWDSAFCNLTICQ